MIKFYLSAFAITIFAATAQAACPSSCQNSTAHAAPVVTMHQVVHHEEAAKDIVGTAASIEDFSTLVAAVKAAGLVEALQGEGPFTVFAPTNEAFARLPEGTVANLLKPENKQQLTNILLYHVVPGKVLATDVVNVTSAHTLLEGKDVSVKVVDGSVFIDNAKVVKTDVLTSNGVIHVIDSVIIPAE